MFTILTVMILNALWIIGINRAAYYYVTDDQFIDQHSKMVLWKVRRFIVNRFGEFWAKPLITCPVCMASVHGAYWYWPILGSLTVPALLIWIVYTVALAGLIAYMEK